MQSNVTKKTDAPRPPAPATAAAAPTTPPAAPAPAAPAPAAPGPVATPASAPGKLVSATPVPKDTFVAIAAPAGSAPEPPPLVNYRTEVKPPPTPDPGRGASMALVALGAGFTGALESWLLYPFNKLTNTARLNGTSLRQEFRDIKDSGRWGKLYQGWTPDLSATILRRAWTLAMPGVFAANIAELTGRPKSDLAVVAASGMLTGATDPLLTLPAMCIRTQLQADKFASPIEAFRHIARTGGLSGFYAGLPLAMTRGAGWVGLWRAGIELGERLVPEAETDEGRAVKDIAISGTSAFAATVLNSPLEVLLLHAQKNLGASASPRALAAEMRRLGTKLFTGAFAKGAMIAPSLALSTVAAEVFARAIEEYLAAKAPPADEQTIPRTTAARAVEN